MPCSMMRAAGSLTWSWLGVIVRVERSLIDLLSTIQHLEAAGVELYLDQQNFHTTGWLMLQG